MSHRLIDEILDQKTISLAISNGLQKDLEAFNDFNKKISKIAQDLIYVADQLDIIKQDISVAHIEDALEKIAMHMNYDLHLPEKKMEDINHISILINASDSLDKLGYCDIANHVDYALRALTRKCFCIKE